MKTNTLTLIDFDKVDTLLEGFNKLTGFVTVIMDLEGNVLSKSGRRQICTEFHRKHPETSKKCRISDRELANEKDDGEKYHFYKCLNGLVDVAVPIVINGEHIANLFSGQFFFEEPDRMFFKQQADQYGFNRNNYLEALGKVPVFSKEKVLVAMDFLLNMTQLISEMTFQKREQTELTITVRESAEKFKSVFESANVGKSITLPTGEINVNQSFCDMLGYTREELQNKKWQDLTPQDEIQDVQNILETLLKGEKDSVRFEKRYICKNGTCIWTDLSTSVRNDMEGKPLHFITTVIDITERKRIEEERRLSEELFSNAFHVGPAGMTITRIADGKFIDANESFCKLFEFDRDEVVGHTSTELNLWTPEERKKMIQQQIVSGGLRNFELLARSKTGRLINLLFSSEQMELKGEPCHITTMIDITKRQQAEKSLVESENRYRSLFENMNAGFVLFEVVQNERGIPVDLVILAANEGFEKTTGLNLKDSIGAHLTKVLPGIEKDEAEWIGTYSKVALSGKSVQFEQGSELLGYHYSISAFQAGPKQCAVTFVDISERKRAEEELNNEVNRRRVLMEQSRDGIVILDQDGMVFESNKKFSDMLGYPPESMGNLNVVDWEYLHPPERVIEMIRSVDEKGDHFESKHRRKDGSIYDVEISTNAARFKGQKLIFCICRDITERKHADEEIKRQLDELQRWHTLTLGRESRVSEIKSEVNELLIRLGEPIRYPSQEGSVSDKQDAGEGG